MPPRKSATPSKKAARCSIRKFFDAIDDNGNGEITLAEVIKAFEQAAAPKTTLTYPELTAACSKHIRRGSARRRLFK